ncbi:hypothetical protein TRFO_35524 [Tritrichomonas foetus]|uniref:Uncharacterized protein n=1 Tax=Tritrichomonas foetus TaxID=1144522 RepID=A0A1J4JG38_9EUKA|nr:hypothetical protein TRFO_35524 [Tritrichomonas foetus]|eukprot:OHS98106.1 hypothetical protein TRFO_35524 [Tritrichomonas foetus]
MIPPDEQDIRKEIDSFNMRKIYEFKYKLNNEYIDFLQRKGYVHDTAYSQINDVFQNRRDGLDKWKKNFINQAQMTFQGDFDLINFQEEAANEEITERGKSLLRFKAKLIEDIFPEEAEYFRSLGWKSPIDPTEKPLYPYRPKATGTANYIKEPLFKEYDEKQCQEEETPSIVSVLNEMTDGSEAIYNVPGDVAFYGNIVSFDEDKIKFKIRDTDEELVIPLSVFVDSNYHFDQVPDIQ